MTAWMWRCVIVVALVLASGSGYAQVQDFPNRPVRVIVPTSPGGLLDVVMRLVAQKMTEVMGQTVVLEHRPGASTNIGAELAARAPADGYTLLSNSLPLVVNPHFYGKLPYNAEKDFAPVSLVASAPYVLVVHPSVPARSIKELIALAKAKPGVLNYATGGNGTNFHIATELFKNMTGTRITHVPYRGGGLALAAVVSGESDLTFPSVASVLPQINAGRVRALAISSTRRSPLLPGLPTIAEAGVPGFEFASWVGLFAPVKTPAGIIGVLNGHIVKAARAPDLAARLAKDGLEVIASSPEQFGAYIKAEFARWAKVIKDAGLRAQ